MYLNIWNIISGLSYIYLCLPSKYHPFSSFQTQEHDHNNQILTQPGYPGTLSYPMDTLPRKEATRKFCLVFMVFVLGTICKDHFGYVLCIMWICVLFHHPGMCYYTCSAKPRKAILCPCKIYFLFIKIFEILHIVIYSDNFRITRNYCKPLRYFVPYTFRISIY